MKRSFALSCADGSVWVMHIHDDNATPEGELQKFSAEDQKKVVGITALTEADIPSDRSYRNGWTVKGGKIDHDITKCRDLHRDKMRAARVPRLAELDVDYQRADEASDVQRKKDIAKAKQELRDVTKLPEIDAAQTVDDLKKVWPGCLGAR